MKKTRWIIATLLLFILVFTACTKEPSGTVTETETPAQTKVTPEPTAEPTSTPEETEEPDSTEEPDDTEDPADETATPTAPTGATVVPTTKPQTASISTQTWALNEVTLNSDKKYSDAYRDVDVDLILTNGKTMYKIPCFWNGSTVWKCRFYCPTAGSWSYYTECTDTANSGLHNQKCNITVTANTSSYPLYKNGFVKTNGSKYFVYDNGTPFFYLGDTHWSLGEETVAKVQTMAAKRSEQQFTVIQSEPIGAGFTLSNGVQQSDMSGLKKYDQKFAAIAENGLVHANAQFFYPSQMATFIENNGGYSKTSVGTASGKKMYKLSDQAIEELKRLTRYWVARYTAYPVMWTLGQEVDNDFYWERGDNHTEWSYVNNPYLLVAEYIRQYDPYQHPLTAHQENTGATKVNNSAFKNTAEHTWYAAQWSPNTSGQYDESVVTEYWNQSKPTVLYEGRYCYLWTKNFGARAQGWIAYLSGMYGYGWGGQDTWSYKNTYNENTDSNDYNYLETICADEKKWATYEDSYSYTSTTEMGYMHKFFEEKVGDWWNLLPENASKVTIQASNIQVYTAVAATSKKDKAVIYFYNTASRTELDTEGKNRYHSKDKNKEYPYYNSPYPENANSSYPKETGGIYGLKNGTYTVTWFNPVTNAYSSGGTINVSSNMARLPQKPSSGDMVMLLTKN